MDDINTIFVIALSTYAILGKVMKTVWEDNQESPIKWLIGLIVLVAAIVAGICGIIYFSTTVIEKL